MTTQSNSVRARRKAERPGEILQAAFEEFSRLGYAATRLEDVAERAGVTKGTIYFYFPDKERLFIALIKDLVRPLLANADEFLESKSGSTVDFLRGHLRLVYQSIIKDPRRRQILRLMIAEAERFPALVDEYYRDVVGPAIEKMRRIILMGVAGGELRASPATAYPELIFGPATALNVWALLYSKQHPIDVERYFEAHIDLVLHGLLPDGSPKGRSTRRSSNARSTSKIR